LDIGLLRPVRLFANIFLHPGGRLCLRRIYSAFERPVYSIATDRSCSGRLSHHLARARKLQPIASGTPRSAFRLSTSGRRRRPKSQLLSNLRHRCQGWLARRRRRQAAASHLFALFALLRSAMARSLQLGRRRESESTDRLEIVAGREICISTTPEQLLKLTPLPLRLSR
jgi:hypothetical protein